MKTIDKIKKMPSSKYFISYFVLGTYVTSVFLITLALALILSLAGVERSNCSESTTVVNRLHDVPQRDRRLVADEEKFKNFKSKSKYAEIKAAPSCKSLFNQTDVNGSLWKNPRLPTNVIPTRYDLELYLEYIFLQSYNGQVDITLTLTEEVNTIILHSHLLDIYTTLLRDNANNIISIQCADYYPDNEYYVIRTTNMIKMTQAPLKLTLQFDGYLNLYETGIFTIQFGSGTEFNGYFLILSFNF